MIYGKFAPFIHTDRTVSYKELSFLITKSYNEEKNQEIDLLVCRLYNLNEEEITYIISQ